MVAHLIPSAHQIDGNPRRLLRAGTPYYTLSEHRCKKAVLGGKPGVLGHVGEVDQRVWKQYQTYLARTTPLERAEFYARQMRERGLRSAAAVARVVGEERHVVGRYLRLLELPEPIRKYLAEHRAPELVRYFSEAKLRELVRIGDPKAAWRRFREMLAEAERESGIWRSGMA